MEELRQIIDEKLRQNRSCRAEMLSVIASGESIAFVGAGLSTPLKYPSWEGLLADLHGHAEKLGSFSVTPDVKADALKWADAIKTHFVAHDERLYYELLGRGFAPKGSANCTDTHKLLVGLPFRGFATSNYETCIESAIRAVKGGTCPDHGVIVKMDGGDRHRVSAFLRSLTDGAEWRYVAHVHGRYDDTRNMVLTEKDYQLAYGMGGVDGTTVSPYQETLHRKLTWALFATRQMVFVGCSMNDPYIRALLDAVQRDMWEKSERKHYVILGLGAKDLGSAETVANTCSRYGLQVVYYDNLDGKHLGLDQLLGEAGALGRASSPTAVSSPAPSPTPATPTAISGSAGWLEDVNQRNAPKLTDE